MISIHFENQRPIYCTSVIWCIVLLAALCSGNGILNHKTDETVDPLQSASESSTMPDTTKQSETAVLDLGSLLDAGDGALVTLVTADTRLLAHKAVLITRSPVFADMICPDILEANSSEVNVPDMEGPVLRQLVAFIYTGRAPERYGMGAQALAVAGRYGVSAIEDPCGQLSHQQLSVENTAAVAVLAVRNNCHSLKQAAVAFIKDHLEVMATQGWYVAVHDHPDDVVQFTRLLAGTSATATADRTPTATAAPAAPAATSDAADSSSTPANA